MLWVFGLFVQKQKGIYLTKHSTEFASQVICSLQKTQTWTQECLLLFKAIFAA